MASTANPESQPGPQLESWRRFGRWATGSAMAAANGLQQGFHAGIGAFARTVREAAQRADELPGSARLAVYASDAADEAGRRAEQAKRREARARELARDEAASSVPWSESAAATAAETLLAPFDDFAGLLLRGLDTEPASERASRGFLRVERGEEFVAVAREAGTDVLTRSFELAAAALHAAYGETEPLHHTMEDALAQMRLLAAEGELGDLLPETRFDEPLQRRARLVVERAPQRLLDALADGDGGPIRVLRAAFDDADDLGVLLLVYPQTVSLVVAKVGRSMLAGELDARKLRAFLRGRREAARTAT